MRRLSLALLQACQLDQDFDFDFAERTKNIALLDAAVLERCARLMAGLLVREQIRHAVLSADMMAIERTLGREAHRFALGWTAPLPLLGYVFHPHGAAFPDNEGWTRRAVGLAGALLGDAPRATLARIQLRFPCDWGSLQRPALQEQDRTRLAALFVAVEQGCAGACVAVRNAWEDCAMMILMDRGKLASADGKVIKANDFARLATAQETLAEANRRAAEIVALAETQREAAIRQGRELGIEQGRAEYAASMVEAAARMDSSFISLEARLVKTVMDALQAILYEIGDRTVMEKLVRRTIANSSRKNSFRLTVASQQFDTVNALLSPVLAEFPEIEFIDVVQDPAGVPGMCVLESEFGIVDASLDTQIAAIRAGLTRAFVGKRRSGPAGQ